MKKNSIIKRNPYRMVHSSSFDRGLAYLLKMWPDIKKEVPEAELHIFYGTEIFLAIHKNNPSKMRWLNQLMEMMKQDGVTYHGRVGKKELYEELQKSGIWAFYCTFQEISCIGAMESQIYGAIPVTTDYAALQETVRCGGLRIVGDPFDAETQENYKKELISLLKDHKRQEEIRGNMMKTAKEIFGWNKVAQFWDALFNSSLKLDKILTGKETGKEE